MRGLLSPAWVARHAVATALVVAFALLGRWQWQTGREAGHWDFQNLTYAVQWWLFGAFVLYAYGRWIYEELHPAPKEEEPAPPVPQPSPVPDDRPLSAADQVLAAYNAYLARLAADPGASKTWRRAR